MFNDLLGCTKIYKRGVPCLYICLLMCRTNLSQSECLSLGEIWGTHVKVRINEDTGDIFLVDINPAWKQCPSLPFDQLDYFTAQLEMAFHGFGGGSARMTELVEPTMFHCVFSNETIYYSLSSLKGFNNGSQRQFKEVQCKLPPIISRFFLLFRSLIQNNESIFLDGGSHFFMLPRRVN